MKIYWIKNWTINDLKNQKGIVRKKIKESMNVEINISTIGELI